MKTAALIAWVALEAAGASLGLRVRTRRQMRWALRDCSW